MKISATEWISYWNDKCNKTGYCFPPKGDILGDKVIIQEQLWFILNNDLHSKKNIDDFINELNK